MWRGTLLIAVTLLVWTHELSCAECEGDDTVFTVDQRSVSDSMAEAKFKESQLVPDVIPSPPAQKAEVHYGSHEVAFGNELTPTMVKNAPTSISWPAEPNALYTIIMSDPDAPSRKDPRMREWRHWLIVNVPGTDVGRGNMITGYAGSTPPRSSGKVREVKEESEKTTATGCAISRITYVYNCVHYAIKIGLGYCHTCLFFTGMIFVFAGVMICQNFVNQKFVETNSKS